MSDEIDYLGPDPNDMDGEKWGPLADEAAARADARTHIPPAGGMTRDETEDVYRDNPGNLYTMLGELE